MTRRESGASTFYTGTLPHAHGFIDYMEQRGAILDVRGWMLDLEGAFEHVDCSLAQETGVRALRVERLDVESALPHIRGAKNAGFHVEVATGALASPELPFTLLGARGGSPRARMVAAYYAGSSGLPVPSPDLMRRVAHTELDYIFRAGGMKGCWDLTRALRGHLSARSGARLLDWGCGSARVTRHLSALFPSAEIHGADIDGEAVAWSRVHFPRVRFATCGLQPPLPYPDRYFEAVIGGSVFAHLPRAAQESWLTELHRILAPGGRLVASTLGDFALHHRSPERAPALLRLGLDDSTRDDTLAGIVPAGSYRATYQTREYTAAAWSRAFEVLDYEPGGYLNLQDLWVLRRLARSTS